MDLLNDKTSERSEKKGFDPFQVVTLAFFSAAGTATFLLAPLPILLAALRLPEPWPKVVGLGGAMIALLVLEIPAAWVALSFTLGLVFADQLVTRRKTVWTSLAVSGGASTLTAGGMVLFYSNQAGRPPLPYWKELVHGLVVQLQASVQPGVEMDWVSLESLVSHQGPFLLVSAFLLAAWLSLGLAAHLGWVDSKEVFSGAALRETLRLPSWLSVTAGVAVGFTLAVPLPYYIAGSVRWLGCLLFIQGCVCLSLALHRKNVVPWARTLVYLTSVVFGFYALVALGMISPWYFRLARMAAARKDLQENKTI